MPDDVANADMKFEVPKTNGLPMRAIYIATTISHIFFQTITAH